MYKWTGQLERTYDRISELLAVVNIKKGARDELKKKLVNFDEAWKDDINIQMYDLWMVKMAKVGEQGIPPLVLQKYNLIVDIVKLTVEIDELRNQIDDLAWAGGGRIKRTKRRPSRSRPKLSKKKRTNKSKKSKKKRKKTRRRRR